MPTLYARQTLKPPATNELGITNRLSIATSWLDSFYIVLLLRKNIPQSQNLNSAAELGVAARCL